MAGYSGTPLAKKLGFVSGMRLLTIGAPPEFIDLLAPLPEDLRITSRAKAPHAAVHVFANDAQKLSAVLTRLRSELAPSGFVWVSWPKKSSKVPTDITEDTIRKIALPLGFVDVKVCAVNEVWSGLKLVIRKELRV